MARTLLIIGILLFIILIGGGIAIYIIYFKSNNQTQQPISKDVLVEAIDGYTKQKISINFTVIYNETIIGHDVTRNDSYTKISLPSNINNFQYFISSPIYYTDMDLLGGNKVTITAWKIGNISVQQIGRLNESNHILLNLTSNYNNREISICVRWSDNIINVFNDNYKQIRELSNQLDCIEAGYIWFPENIDCGFWCKMGFKDKIISSQHCSSTNITKLPPHRLVGKIDRCFYIKKDITNTQSLLIDLFHKSYSTLNNNDFIRVYIIDSNNNFKNVYVFEDENGNDVGAKDIEFVIK